MQENADVADVHPVAEGPIRHVVDAGLVQRWGFPN